MDQRRKIQNTQYYNTIIVFQIFGIENLNKYSDMEGNTNFKKKNH